MNIDLMSKKHMIGHWDTNDISQCEFQFGTRLIYVEHPSKESEEKYLTQAQKSVVEVWNDIENAVHFAEQASRKQIPDFWKIHDQSNKQGPRFHVYSIHFTLSELFPVYVISGNRDFDFQYISYAEEDLWMENPIQTPLPEPPENFWLHIKRLGKQHFETTAKWKWM